MRTPLKIGFYAAKCLPFHAHSLDERPLGGTETACIRLAECLAELGHDVTVFTNHPAPPASTPRYVNAQQIAEYQAGKAGQLDVLVTIRDWWPVFARLNAKKLFYWCGDAYDQYATMGIGDRRISSKLDGFLAVSEWHARTMSEASGFPLEKMFVIRNGVHLPYFAGREERARKRLFYSSTPYRGLELTIPLFKELRQRHPDCELHVFSGLKVYDTDKPFDGPEEMQAKRIFTELEKIDGVKIRGNLLQRELAREMLRASVLFYPNIFPETSCITALEAMAAGAPVVTSALGALPETVGRGGIVVSGTPGEKRYMQEFVKATDKLLTDDRLFEELSNAARAHVEQDYSWHLVAERFQLVC